MAETFDVVLYLDRHSPAALDAERNFERVRSRFPGARFHVSDAPLEGGARRDGTGAMPTVVVSCDGRVRATLAGAVLEEPLARALREGGVPHGEWPEVRRDADALGARLRDIERDVVARAQRNGTRALLLEQADLDTAAALLCRAEQARDEASARQAVEAARLALRRWD